jgi:hypothetical protein
MDDVKRLHKELNIAIDELIDYKDKYEKLLDDFFYLHDNPKKLSEETKRDLVKIYRETKK